MHAVLLEKERVAVKMRHAVLKGDLVVLERFRKAGAAALGDALFERPVRQKARGGIGAALYVPKLCGRTDALCGTPPHAAGIFGIDADIFPRHGAADDALSVAQADMGHVLPF